MKKSTPKYRALFISAILTLLALVTGLIMIDGLTVAIVIDRVAFPLLRLLLFILLGLVLGQVIEASGWTRYLAALANPLFTFGNLGKQCSAAFTAAFLSGVTANAMLLGYYKDGLISKRQMYLSNMVNHLPAYFLHLPTTFFMVIPLTGVAGMIYFMITLSAVILRTVAFLLFGNRCIVPIVSEEQVDNNILAGKQQSRSPLLTIILQKVPVRIINMGIYVLPIYTLVFLISQIGLFDQLNLVMNRFLVLQFIPVEALSVVILSFAAEFTAGFAAAGAMLDSGVISVKQTVLALVIGNIMAFPLRALRHQLPRYIGIFSPKMGTEILLLGQGFRIISLIMVTVVYYLVA